jgi:hypothetical protein
VTAAGPTDGRLTAAGPTDGRLTDGRLTDGRPDRWPARPMAG